MPFLRSGPLFLVVVLGACGGRAKRKVQAVPVPTVKVGDCGNPGVDGVMGGKPDAVHADKDLDGDGAEEVVVADRTMCTPEGNCYWNVFVSPPAGAADQCQRFAGTLAAVALETVDGRGEDGFANLRGYWRLTGGGRLLLQEYRFRRGGYHPGETILCRRQADDRLVCEEPEGDPASED